MVLELILPILIELIAAPINSYVVRPIKRHVSYAFKCESKVQTLQHDVEQLNNTRLRLQQSVDEATRNGEEIYPNVTNWLSTTEKDIDEADRLIQEIEEAKKKCFAGICPNLKACYQLSKKAEKKALAIDKQLQNAQGLDPIAFRLPLQQIVEPSMYSREALPSRVLILNQIMDALKDPNLNMLGVYGMGGVGKTTLAKEVQGKAVEQKLFETAVLVSVSQTPELRRIQGEIADSLGLIFDAAEVPGRAIRLHHRLKKANVLIILDDVWQHLDLSAVGIPFGDAYKGCKLLLTSRRKDVLSNEMCTQKEFSLDVLEEKETWKLFEMSVAKAKEPALRAIATEVAKKCAGLPLLILKVATDLRNKDSYAWSDMLNQLSSLENTEIYEIVHKVIESSYEKLLDEEAKSLFLLCALFGNSSIRIPNLLKYCVGLGLFKRINSIEGARNRVLTLIDKLKNACLLLDGDKDGFVKIHDVVRDIALAIASRMQHAFVGTSKIRSTDLQNRDCTRISLPYCDITELPGVLKCPEAEVFSLFMEDLMLDIPDSFFEGVEKLKVVDFSGVHFVSGLPSSLGFLTGLQTLCLDRCRFENVAIIAELKQLEFLSFANSYIKELPEEIKALTRLKLLDLRACYYLQVIPANVLSNLSLLEELYIYDSFHQWEAEGNASLVELKNLSYLTTLEIQVKDDKLLPEDWFFNELRNYRISIGSWGRVLYSKYESSRILKLELKTSIGLIHRIKRFVRGTEVLHLRKVEGIENLLYDPDGKGFPQLRHLILDDSSIQHLIKPTMCSFPIMESLYLENLKSLEKIYDGELGIDSFGELKTLSITRCNKLKSLFSYSSAKCLPQLQKMAVLFCDNMEAIFGEGSADSHCNNQVVELTALSSLTLFCLPIFKGISKTSGMVSLLNLTSLEVAKCKSLKYVFTTTMLKSLEQLKKLEIDECMSMEEIILGEEIEENMKKVVFPKLDYLKLRNLGKMERFSSGYLIDFPSLRELEIQKCQAMENFVSKSSIRSNENESTDEYLFNEMVTFSNLEKIEIEGMDKLRYLWHQQFADDDSFSKLKVLVIDYCSKLSVVFPSNVHRRFQSLQALRLYDCNGVKEIYEYEGVSFEETNIVQQFALQRMYICKLPSLKHIWNKDTKEAFSFKNLQSLEVDYCENLKYVFPASVACGLLQLQELKIRNCGVEMLISNAKKTLTFEWPKLKKFEVYHCDKLIKFSSNISKAKDSIPTQYSPYFVEKIIPNVKDLTLDHHSLKALHSDGSPVELLWTLKKVALLSLKEESIPFMLGMLRRIYSLEKLMFQNGDSLGEIFSSDDGRAVGEEPQHHLTLKLLEFYSIANLKHIVKKDSQPNPIFQYVQALNLHFCHDLMNIAPFSVSFQNLTTLIVESCKCMINLVTASTAKSMVQLAKLSVYACKMMEEIVANDRDCIEDDIVIIFKKLKHLILTDLDRLNSFCSGNYIFNFPLLEQVTVERCSRMKIFCGGVLSTPKLQGILFGCEQKWEVNLNATIASQL